MLEVRELTKRFDATQALRSVSLSFPAGEITALMGENGAGKSTLLNILAGVVTPTAGGIYRDGQLVKLPTARSAREHGIAIIPQEPDIVGSLSVAENIFLGLLPRTGHVVRRRELRRAAADLLERTGFSGSVDPDAPGSQLGPAGRQVVEILRAVVAQPKLIAFDEPTSSLGHAEVERLRVLIRGLRDSGLAIIYVSHRRAEIEDLATRIAVLRDGRVAGMHEGAGVSFRQILREMAGRESAEGVVHVSRSGDGQPLLTARSLRTRKLRNVSLQVQAGEIVGVAGLAGSGRSELARALVGDRQLDGGEIKVAGETVSGKPRSPRASGIGYIPEDRRDEGLVMTRSVRENIALASLPELRRMRIVRRRQERELVAGLIDRLAIRCSSQDAPVTSLSGGNQQKVVLARSIAFQPRVWVLDDPTKGIDIGSKEAFYRIIEGFAENGAATVMISSELPELSLLCDRVLVMRGGEIVAELARGEATEPRIIAAMFGELPDQRPERSPQLIGEEQ